MESRRQVADTVLWFDFNQAGPEFATCFFKIYLTSG